MQAENILVYREENGDGSIVLKMKFFKDRREKELFMSLFQEELYNIVFDFLLFLKAPIKKRDG